MFSYVQDHFFDKEATEISLSVSPDFYDYDEVNFFTKIYFYDEPKDGEGLPLLDGEKMEVKLKFRFNDLFHEDIPILIIKKSINEELEKSTDLINFNKDIIKLRIGYSINHPISNGNEVISGFKQFLDLKLFI